MLQRKPRPAFWKFIKTSAKTLFVIEAVAFAVSYGVWYRMNTNRDFRQYLSENFPIILESYYKFGEVIGESKVRQLDRTVWNQERDTTATAAANNNKNDSN